MLHLRTTFIIGLFATLITSGVHAEGLSLVQAEAMWRAANIDLKLAAHAVSAAEGDRASADRHENPNLSLSSTSLSPRAGIGGGNLRDKSADSVIRIEQLVERGNKRQWRSQGAEARLRAAQMDVDEAARAGLIQLHAAYWDLKLAIERERLAAEFAQLARQAETVAEKRFSAGDIALADVSKLRVDALRGDNDARTVVADRQKAQLALALIIGPGDDVNSLSCSDDWPSVIDIDPSLAITDSQVADRSDVRAANLRVVAAESALESARSLRSRDIIVGLQFEHFPPAGNTVPNNTWGVSVSIPLFASHAYEGEVIRARAELDQARDQAIRSRALAKAEASRAVADLRSGGERVKRLETALLPEAGKVAAAAEFAYGKGAVGLLDLLDARRTFRQIQLEAITARNEFAKALAAMRLQLPLRANK